MHAKVTTSSPSKTPALTKATPARAPEGCQRQNVKLLISIEEIRKKQPWSGFPGGGAKKAKVNAPRLR